MGCEAWVVGGCWRGDGGLLEDGAWMVGRSEMEDGTLEGGACRGREVKSQSQSHRSENPGSVSRERVLCTKLSLPPTHNYPPPRLPKKALIVCVFEA